MSGGLREIAAPFVAAAPAGARVRARLRVAPEDEAVLRAAGSHLGSLAGCDLAARCAEGRLDAKGRAASRARRKRALTAGSSSRWAGAITRVSEDQWGLAERNLGAERESLRARARAVEARLAVPAGGRQGRARGYATPAERHAKDIRLRGLKGRLARAERRAAAGTVSVTRGGRSLLRKRANLAAAGLTEDEWRAEWEASRWFLTADGEKDKAWGNETIRWHPGERWLEVRLPAPAQLTWRACQVLCVSSGDCYPFVTLLLVVLAWTVIRARGRGIGWRMRSAPLSSRASLFRVLFFRGPGRRRRYADR